MLLQPKATIRRPANNRAAICSQHHGGLSGPASSLLGLEFAEADWSNVLSLFMETHKRPAQPGPFTGDSPLAGQRMDGFR